MAYHHTFAAIALSASLTACVASNADANIIILHNSAPSPDCLTDADPEGGFNSSGVIDKVGGTGYVFTPIVQNFAAGEDSLRIAFIRGARIDIHFADEALEDSLGGQDGLTRFQVPLSGSIPPDGGTVGLVFEIVPAALVEQLAEDDLMLVDVRIFGEIGGGSFESANFRYPIEVCEGCTVQDLGDCALYDSSFMGAGVPNGCNLYQDTFVECCTNGQAAVCPAVGSGA
jgi:hypothetical protein